MESRVSHEWSVVCSSLCSSAAVPVRLQGCWCASYTLIWVTVAGFRGGEGAAAVGGIMWKSTLLKPLKRHGPFSTTTPVVLCYFFAGGAFVWHIYFLVPLCSSQSSSTRLLRTCTLIKIDTKSELVLHDGALGHPPWTIWNPRHVL